MSVADFDVLVEKTEPPPVLVNIAPGYCFLCWLLCLPCSLSLQGPAKHDPCTQCFSFGMHLAEWAVL